MLNLTYDEKIHLDKWNIDVKPYLTLKEMEGIVRQLIMKNNGLERDMCLIANILVLCTTIYDSNKEADYTYEDLMYSGFWTDLLSACPILFDNIKLINREVNEFFSIDKKIYRILDSLEDKIDKVDISDVMELLKSGEIKQLLEQLNQTLEDKNNASEK